MNPNTKNLVAFCRKHKIVLHYNYDPRFGGGHTFEFMGKHGNGWIQLTRRVFDGDLKDNGWGIYESGLLHELKTDFVPKMREGNANGNGESDISFKGV